jgi:DNA polymerase-3 subunit delta
LHPVPVIVLAGEEDFELYRRLKRITEELVDPAWAAFNYMKLDKPDVAAVIDAAASLPFGAGKKVVLVDRCDFFTKKRSKPGEDGDKAAPGADKALKRQLEDLDRALELLSPDTYLIFACPHNFDSTLKLSRVVSKHALIEEFPKEKYWPGSSNARLETWCRKEAQLHGAVIDDAAIHYLLESTEANLRQMASEIAKAAIFVLPEKKITPEAVATLSSHQSHVFTMLDQWAHGKHKDALTSLEELLSRQSGLPVLAAVHTIISKWIQLKTLAAAEEARLPYGPAVARREIPAADLARKLAGALHAKPYAVEMDLKRVRGLSLERLTAKREQVCRLDYLVKTGQLPDTQALTIFLTT